MLLAHFGVMIPSIAFVGAGPTTIYTLHALLNHARCPFVLTIFEEQAIAGRGTPYRPGWNDPAMLSNIASIEIPPLEETLVEWLKRQPAKRFATMGIEPDEIDDRAFYPRVLLGEYFRDQFHALVARAQKSGISVDVRTSCRVLDAISKSNGIQLSMQSSRGELSDAVFDHLVLATGHQWPEHPEVRPGYFLSPWPASALAKISPVRVGIRGASLTGIDAAVALAVAHGEFVDHGDRLHYVPAPETEAFHLTMMSRKGLLPEADFYFPIPYEPLAVCNVEAIKQLIGAGNDNLLDATFALLKQELAALDPAYAAQINLAGLTLEEFRDSYFAERIDANTFEWAEQNLQEAERNYADQVTVPWRYAILRMHEVVALVVPHLDDADFERFATYLKPVFIDDYATVPHKSIKRMLALHAAGKLDIVAIGDRHRVESHLEAGGATVRWAGNSQHFDAFIEAIGQRPLGAKEFPFPSLRKQGVVRDVASPVVGAPSRGIVIDDQFHLIADNIPADQLFCLSLPFILGRHPFVQGITSSHEMGGVVGAELARAIGEEAKCS